MPRHTVQLHLAKRAAAVRACLPYFLEHHGFRLLADPADERGRPRTPVNLGHGAWSVPLSQPPVWARGRAARADFVVEGGQLWSEIHVDFRTEDGRRPRWATRRLYEALMRRDLPRLEAFVADHPGLAPDWRQVAGLA